MQRLPESGQLQLRLEVFNVFNHANLNNPFPTLGTFLGQASFGRQGFASALPSAAPLNDQPRRVQLAMKGNKDERYILIRDGSKVVSGAVLQSPKLSDAEVQLALKLIEQTASDGFHPERYEDAADITAHAAAWRSVGAVLQVNGPSLTGRFGSRAKRRVEALLAAGLVDYVASDFHARGASGIEDYVRLLEERARPEQLRLLTIVNPARILGVAGGSLAGALAGLFFFYLSFEFTIVSELPLVSEILPEARASLMATNVAAFSLGRAAGSLLAPWLFGMGIAANALAALVFYLLAFFALGKVRLRSEELTPNPL